MTSPTPASAALYLRISRDLKGDGLAIDRQRELCRAIADQRGWSVAAEYMDESISAFAKNVRRPGYDAMVKDQRAGKFQAIICYDLDRLTRQPRQLEDWIDAAESDGLKLVTANGEADLSTDGGRMYARIKASVARAESERKAQRQRDANAQRVKIGKPPLGVRLTGYTPQGDVIESEAAIIRDIYAQFLRGGSLRGICQRLTEDGVATRHGGAKWNPTSVYAILRNPRYAGHGKYYDEVIEDAGGWAAIVSPADYAATKAKLDDPTRKTNKTGTDRKHLGSGLFLCGVCRDLVSSFTGKRYRCREGHSTRSMETIDFYVSETIAAFLDQTKATPPAQGERGQELEAKATAARERLRQVQADYDAGFIDGRRFKAASDRAEAELAAADRERIRLTHGRAAAELMASLNPSQRFRDMALMEKRAVISALADVLIHPAPRGRKAFDPATVEIVWRSAAG